MRRIRLHYSIRVVAAVVVVSLYIPLATVTGVIQVNMLLVDVATQISRSVGIDSELADSIGIAVGLFPFLLATLGCYGLLTLYFGGRPIDHETRCRECNYILRGLKEPRCPECGERI